MRLIGYIAFGLFILSADAQITGIRAFVHGADDKQPLIGAHVISLSNWRESAVTDAFGAFDVKALWVENSDSLIISFVGYNELVINARDLVADAVILLQPVEALTAAVVVTADKLIAETFSSHKIKRLDIYKNPSSKADPLLAVNSLPSTTTADESANISFRGSGPGATGIFLDGVPIYDFVRFSQLDGLGTLSVFNTDLLSNVQVFPGNPPLDFGNVGSGLVAIETLNAVPMAPRKTLSLSLANLGGAYLTPVGEKQSLYIYGNYQPSAVFRALNQEALADIPKFSSLDAGVHYLNQINERWKLKVFNYSQLEGYDFRYATPTFQGIFEQRKSRNLLVANVTRQFENSQLALRSGLNASSVSFDYSGASIDINARDFFVGLSQQWELSKWSAKTGVSLDNRSSDFAGWVPEYSFAERISDPFIFVSSNADRTSVEAFFFYKYNVLSNLSVGAAIRKNIPMFDHERHYLARQLNFSYQLSGHWKINGAHGNFYYRGLESGQGSFSGTTESIQSSLDLFYDAKPVEITAAFFRKKLIRASENETIHGIELAHSLVLTKIKYNISYTFLEAQAQEGDLNYTADFDFDFFIKAGAEWTFLPNWALGVRVLARDGKVSRTVNDAFFRPDLDVYEPTFADLDQRERLSNYYIADANISRIIPVSDKLSIVAFGNVSNFMDFKNVRSYRYTFDYQDRSPQYFSRRSVYFGVVLNFL